MNVLRVCNGSSTHVVEEVGFLWVQGKSGLHESSRTVNDTQRDPVKKRKKKTTKEKGKERKISVYVYNSINERRGNIFERKKGLIGKVWKE